MILDNYLVFDPWTSAGVGTAITTTRTSTNVIDLQGANLSSGLSLTPPVQQGRDIGIAPEWYPVHVKVQVLQALTGGTSINCQVQGAPDNGSGSPGSYYTIFESGVILTAALLAGADIIDAAIASVPAGYALPRFLQLNYVVVGTFGAGTVAASLSAATDDNVIGPTGAFSGYKPGVLVSN